MLGLGLGLSLGLGLGLGLGLTCDQALLFLREAKLLSFFFFAGGEGEEGLIAG